MPVQPSSTTYATRVATFAQSGTLTVGTGVGRYRVEANAVILGVEAMVNTAPTGAAIVLDCNKNGTTIYTTQSSRPTIAISANSGAQVAPPDVTALVAGDYLTIDVDQIGSSVAGANLVVTVRFLLS
jgi:hypothetical protein